ncbi:MAG: oligosaccharide flippase family protein, partial [Pseudomonadales bacterium]
LPLVATLFQHGAMTVADARMAALALEAFAVGLLPLVLVKVAAPAYFAREDTATPFRFAVIAVLTNIALNLALFSWMGHVGLALATSAAAWVNALLLLRGIGGAAAKPAHRYRPTRALWLTAGRSSLTAGIMAALLWWWLPPATAWLDAGLWDRAWWLTTAVAAGIGGYALGVMALGERPRMLLHRA